MVKLGKLPARLTTPGTRIESMVSSSWRSDKQSAAARGYGHKWRTARAAYLSDNPLCVYCAKSGIVKAAQVVDHIEPHRGDMSLFWRRSNWQALCTRCHDTTKAEQEGRHHARARLGADGRVVW